METKVYAKPGTTKHMVAMETLTFVRKSRGRCDIFSDLGIEADWKTYQSRLIEECHKRGQSYDAIWGGDPGECGIWLGDNLIVSVWDLWERNLSASQVAGWSQGAIDRLVEEMARK